MVLSKLTAIVFSLSILGQSYALRQVYGTWTLPACLFGLFWFGYTFIPLVVAAWVPVEPLAIALILACCLAFSSTTVAFDWPAALAVSRRREQRSNYQSPVIRWTFLCASFLSIILLFVDILAQGFSVADIVFSLMRTASLYIKLRYTGDIAPTVAGQISTTLMYPAAILGGLLFATRPKAQLGLVVLSLVAIPSLVKMVVQGDKGSLFLVLALFWGGILLAKLSKGNDRLFEKGIVIKAFLAGALLAPFVLASFLARGLYNITDTSVIINALFKYAASYSIAHLYAFSDWFSHFIFGVSSQSYKPNPYPIGYYTFLPILRHFGNADPPVPGYYDEYFSYAELMTTNIYTMFRGLVSDFGLFGSVVFMGLFGGVVNVAYWNVLTSTRPALSASIYAHAIGYFYTSFLISMFVWNSAIASVFVTAAVLTLNAWFCTASRTQSDADASGIFTDRPNAQWAGAPTK